MPIQTLSNGYKKPQSGDRGNLFFPALEDNIDRINAHDHDGTNSEKLTTSSMTAATNSVPSANWAAVSGNTGLFSQVVTLPTGFDIDDYVVSFKDDATGNQLHLTVEKVTASTYRVYCNDNSLTLTAYYGH